ncbi:DNA helicase I [Schizosaccharomyces cryophilus OY26]|uniref:DNA 3'-5' helicase n=1 Tax=Schizosaccharomyces cryophilus (strain OY26 / ATCC MYA-4695 / CBS 11777 / NBRC 106824 / NRRL Y48691) TaxID=653667 RepID=S9W5T4_SCHCR|nr:DNA helicase I [Schizosaccharomyces cryophilus OY26]EPY53904.1 DNA helicase I [Schizosaccharomyces cryophilus OY26]
MNGTRSFQPPFFQLPTELLPLICRFLSVQDIQNLVTVIPSVYPVLEASIDLFWKKKHYEIDTRKNRLLKEALSIGYAPAASNGFVSGTQVSSTAAEREYYAKSDEVKSVCGLPPGPMKIEQVGTCIDYLLTSQYGMDLHGKKIKTSFFSLNDAGDEWVHSMCLQLRQYLSPAAEGALASFQRRSLSSLFLQILFVGMLFEEDLWYYFNILYDVSSSTAIEFAYFLNTLLTIVKTDYEHYRDPLSQTLVSASSRFQDTVLSIESPFDDSFEKGLTAEQKRIVECVLHPGEVLKVKAFAGTGKTKALLEFSRSRPHNKILYVAFNKAAKEEAEQRFPLNVKCSTIHGLAYGAILAQADLPASKLERQLSNTNIANLLSLQAAFPKSNRKAAPGTPSATLVASHIMFTLNRFMHSTDSHLSFRHVSKRSLEVTQLSKEKLLAYARRLWSLIINFDCPYAPLIPDAYMKLLHLYEFPNIFSKFDYILFDEAQDFTRCMVDVIYRQKHARIVIVGDAHQCIYGFRGADACAFDEVLYPSTKQLYLTKSFRFGNSVAKYANFILSLKGENVKLRGVKDDRVFRSVNEPFSVVNQNFRFIPHTVIFRTNKELILQSIRLSVSLPKNIPITILGSMKKKAFQLLRSGSELAHGQRPSHPKLREFTSWAEFETHVKNSAEEDPELALVYDMAEELFSESFLTRLDNCEQRLIQSKDEGENGIILATAHQSKGLEWDNVQLGNDFRPKFDSTSYARIGSSRYLKEEINILYVALTRAKCCLILNDTIAKFYALEKGLLRFAGGVPSLEEEMQIEKVAIFVDWQIENFSFLCDISTECYNFFVDLDGKTVWDVFFGVLSGSWQNYIANTAERLKRTMLFIEDQLFINHS